MVRTRFAPSPTGFLHIGGVRTALFSWLYAKRHGGEFVVRIEDTDTRRNQQGAIQGIADAMQWLNIDYSRWVLQSECRPSHQAAVQQLLHTGCAYHCYCTQEEIEEMRVAARRKGLKPRYDGRCRERDKAPAGATTSVVRLRTPQTGDMVVEDLVQGKVIFANAELDDLVLLRADGAPTYNLAAVVDDYEMQITHVVRGDDHLNNTPRQMHIYQALGWQVPHYAHLPLILDLEGHKLSKRSAASNVLSHQQSGILPEALLNCLLRLGWSHGDQELFDHRQMIELFDLASVNKTAARFDPAKLLWFNQQYMRTAEDDSLARLLQPRLHSHGVQETDKGPPLMELVAVQKSRTRTLEEMAVQSLCFYQNDLRCDEKAWKKHLRLSVLDALRDFHTVCQDLPAWEQSALQQCITDCAARHELKIGKLAQPVRVAITGAAASPGIQETLYFVGRERTLERLQKAIAWVQQRVQADAE